MPAALRRRYGHAVRAQWLELDNDHARLRGRIGSKAAMLHDLRDWNDRGVYAMASKLSNKPMLYIHALDVDAGYRDRGFGGALLERAIRQAKVLGVRHVFLDAVPDDPKLMAALARFYERHKFRVMGVETGVMGSVPFYYRYVR